MKPRLSNLNNITVLEHVESIDLQSSSNPDDEDKIQFLGLEIHASEK